MLSCRRCLYVSLERQYKCLTLLCVTFQNTVIFKVTDIRTSHFTVEMFGSEIELIIIINLTANGLSPGGSGYNACT